MAWFKRIFFLHTKDKKYKLVTACIDTLKYLGLHASVDFMASTSPKTSQHGFLDCSDQV